jgi:uncharacterized membrane protein
MKRHVVNVNTRRLASFFVRAFGAVLLASCCTLLFVILKIFIWLPMALMLILGGIILSCAYLFLGKLFGVRELEKLQDQARLVLMSRGDHG